MARTEDATRGGQTETRGPGPVEKSTSNRARALSWQTGENFDTYPRRADNESRIPKGYRIERNCIELPPSRTASQGWRRPAHPGGRAAEGLWSGDVAAELGPRKRRLPLRRDAG